MRLAVLLLGSVALLLAAVTLGGSARAPTTAEAVLLGDANCDGSVNALDATFLLQFAAGLIDSLPCQDKSDVNGDGVSDSLDAALVLQFDAGLIQDLGTLPSPTVPPTLTRAPTATATFTPTPSASPKSTPTPTPTQAIGASPTATATATSVPTATNTSTWTPTPTATNTATPTATYTPTPTSTYTPTPTPNPVLRNPSAYWIECRAVCWPPLHPDVSCTEVPPNLIGARISCTAPTAGWEMSCDQGWSGWAIADCLHSQDGIIECESVGVSGSCFADDWFGKCGPNPTSLDLHCWRTDDSGTETLDCTLTVTSDDPFVIDYDCTWQGVMDFACEFRRSEGLFNCSPEEG